MVKVFHLWQLEQGISLDGIDYCNWLRFSIGSEDGRRNDGRSGGVVFFNLVGSFENKKALKLAKR